MKTLIILCLVAICLASHRKNARKAFLFPSRPSSDKASQTFVWPEYVNPGSESTEKSSNTEKTSGESGFVLTNPNRRDVKLGKGFSIFGFRGPLNQANSDNIKSNPAIKLENPSFIENATPVLEKEESSSSEESQAVDHQESSSSEGSSQSISMSDSSSEETKAIVVEGKKSSSEETDAPNTNQDAASNQEESPKKAPKPSEENQHSKVFNKEGNVAVKFGFQPLVGPNFLAQEYSLGDMDSKRPQRAKRVRVLRHRPSRSTDFNIPEIVIKLDNGRGRNVVRPQGKIEANHQKKTARNLLKQ